LGQLDFSDRIGKLAITYFPWNKPNYPVGIIQDAASFGLALLLSVIAFPFIGPEAIFTAIGAFGAAGIQFSFIDYHPT